MHLLVAIVLVTTGLIQLSYIMFGFGDTDEGVSLLVRVTRLLFTLSLLFFVNKLPVKEKKEKKS